MDKWRNPPYLSRMPLLVAVDKIVDNSPQPVDELWITRELSTGSGYPQKYPQVYPQIVPPLIHRFIHSRPAPHRPATGQFIHNVEHLSTEPVDK